MASANIPPGLWAGQSIHVTCTTLLLALTWAAWKYLGQPFPVAFWLAVAFPIAHQVFVWLAWRVELQSATITKTIGFRVYVVLFFLLFGGRFISLVALAWMDKGSLNLPLVPQAIITILLTVPGLYAMYSVKRYFGMVRASGADHFEPKYRDMPLVKEGIFRFTSNGMYIYAFLLFWAIATGFNSATSLIVAAFSHAYIWVHFYAIEKPDMNYLYGSI